MPKDDPKRAKALMAEAGFPGGQGLPRVDISSTDALKDELTDYTNQFQRALGLPVSVNVVEHATFIRLMNAGTVAFFPRGWTADHPYAADYLSLMWYGSCPYNRGRWHNAAYDTTIDVAVAEPEPVKRVPLYQQAEKIWWTMGNRADADDLLGGAAQAERPQRHAETVRLPGPPCG